MGKMPITEVFPPWSGLYKLQTPFVEDVRLFIIVLHSDRVQQRNKFYHPISCLQDLEFVYHDSSNSKYGKASSSDFIVLFVRDV